MKIRISIICVLGCLFAFNINAQNRRIDSLRNRLKTDNDTTRVLDDIKLCQAYNGIGDFLQALDFSVKAATLSKSLENAGNPAIVSAARRAEARAYLNIGSTYENQGNYSEALIYYTKALHAKEALNDKQGIANAYNDMGVVYWDQSNYPVALDYFLKSQNIYVTTNNKSGLALTFNNIGNLYLDEQNDDSALSYYQKSFAIEKELNNKAGIIMCYNNLGRAYHAKDKLLTSLTYYKQSLAMRKEQGDEDGIAISYSNIANIYLDIVKADSLVHQYINSYYNGNTEQSPSTATVKQQLQDSAMLLDKMALELSTKTGNIDNVGRATEGIGMVYQERKDFKTALDYYRTAASVYKKIESRKDYYTVLISISQCFEKLGNKDSALDYFKSAMSNKDSVFNEEKQKAIGREEVKNQYEKQQALEEAQHQKEKEIEEVKQKQQLLVIYLGTAAVVLLIAFLVFIVNRLRITNRQKNIIEEQKEKIDVAFAQLGDAKKLLEERHKDLTDSIQYASRIQQALLTTDKYLETKLKDFFILFKPKDIVSGDFYWALEHKGLFYIACCDCTGHGVPGAFMSLLNITFLQQSVTEKGCIKPSDVFNEVRQHVVEVLNPDNTSDTKDGMDAILCALDFNKQNLMAACANNSLWVLRNGNIEEFKGDKMPIGISGGEIKPFTLHETKLQKGDCIYMFSDGYADQFGGPNQKKFLKGRLRELILSIGSKPMHEQKALLEKNFNEWKGNLSQIDDVCVIGIRV